jgi:hypothetical protein
MPGPPKYVKLLPEEQVTRKSKGIGFSAVLWFDEEGKIYTKKPCTGKAFLTNQRLIFEGQEIASAWQNMATFAFWPTAFFIGPDPLNVAIFLKNITEIFKTKQIRAEPIMIAHSQTDLPSPLYFSVNDKDEWIREIQVSMGMDKSFTMPAFETPPPRPPPSSAPICPTCGNPLTYIQQYQRWYCYKEQKYV